MPLSKKDEAKLAAHRCQVALEGLTYGYRDVMTEKEYRAMVQARIQCESIVKRLRRP